MTLSRLAPQARWLFHVQALFRLFGFWTPLLVGAGIGLSFVAPATVAALVAGTVWLALAVVALWLPALTYARWGYALSDTELMVERGVLVRRVTAIPAHRIQHVDTAQGPVDQLLGLARISVYTASGLGADGVIPGLTLAEAERLRDALVQVSEATADDGV